MPPFIKLVWTASFALIIAAGVVALGNQKGFPDGYALPACLNLVAGFLMGIATMLERIKP